MTVKQAIKQLIPTPWLDRQRRIKYSLTRSGSKFIDKDLKGAFTEIYRSNHWNGDASHSGTGSDLTQTRTLRMAIPPLLERLHVKTLLDAPCGDFHWMREVDLRGIDYLGVDIVDELIATNTRRFAAPKVRFDVLDITSDPLPRADLVFCRDALVHLSYDLIGQALARMRASGSRYLLTTTFAERDMNFDIVSGDWRPLNLRKPPFSFPPPLELINENCTEAGTIARDKSMGLWEIRDLPL